MRIFPEPEEALEAAGCWSRTLKLSPRQVDRVRTGKAVP
jgi:hypothetical protein